MKELWETPRGVQRIFSRIWKNYEIVNHLLTWGLDLIWRRRLVKNLPRKRRGWVLDICSGTGETAHLLWRRLGDGVRVVSLDFSFPMLKEGRRKRNFPRLYFLQGDAYHLPFPDNTFQAVSISFATRNIHLSPRALLEVFKEVRRVLKPGGEFIHLETTQPPLAWVRHLFHLYVKGVIRRLGGLISGYPPAYRYLSHTIPRFYPADKLGEFLRKANFSRVNFSYLTLGIVAIHRAIK